MVFTMLIYIFHRSLFTLIPSFVPHLVAVLLLFPFLLKLHSHSSLAPLSIMCFQVDSAMQFSVATHPKMLLSLFPNFEFEPSQRKRKLAS